MTLSFAIWAAEASRNRVQCAGYCAMATALLGLATACQPDVGTAAEPSANSSPAAERPAKVRVTQAEARPLEDVWRFLGDVRADARASVAAGAEGAVTKVAAKLGQPVTRGRLLVEIDPELAVARAATAKAEVDVAAEALAQAEREVARLKGLRRNVVPELERERASSTARTRKAALASARAQLQEAKATMGRHRIRAPFDGVVAARVVDPGDWVKIGDPVMELVSSEGLDIVVDASRALLRYVKRGTTATVIDGEQQTQARVTGVVPALDPVSRTLRVRLVPVENVPWLLPGASVDIAFEVALKADEGQVSVPIDALLSSPAETRVVKVIDGKAAPIVVVVLAKARGSALVRAPELSAGDTIVIRGNERLRPGQRVEVIP